MENLLKVKESDVDRDENEESKGGIINEKKKEEIERGNLQNDHGKDIGQSSDVSNFKKNPSISLPKSLPIPKKILSITSITSKPNPIAVTKEKIGEVKAEAMKINSDALSSVSPRRETETAESRLGEASVGRLQKNEGKEGTEGKDAEVESEKLHATC